MGQLTQEDIKQLLSEAEIIFEQKCEECAGYSCNSYPLCDEERIN